MTTTIDRRITPPMRQVIREQFRATVLSLRVYIIIAAGIAAVATFLAFADFFRRGVGFEFDPEISTIMAICGFILAILVWQKERHFRPGFLWTLPVDRRRHALAKIIGGWLCLMIVAAVFLLWLLTLALITKGNVTGDEVIKLLPTPDDAAASVMDPAMLKTITWIPPKTFWLIPFTAATAAYTLMSAIMLGLRHPFRWIIGAVAGVFLIAALGQGVNPDAFWTKAQSIVKPLTEGRYGIDAVLSARTQSVRTQVLLTDGEYTRVWRDIPTVTDWAVATLLWTGLGFAGLLAALHRHRERR